MPAPFGVKVSGVKEVTQMLVNSPRGVRAAAMREIATYIIGDGRRGLRHYPAYKYISRKAAYGKTFKTDKQRRYVMARIRAGTIDPGYPHRTGNYQRSIQMKDSSDWKRVKIEGKLPHAGWPDKLAAKIGWRSWNEIIQSNLKGAIAAGQRAVNAWIRSRKR